MSRSALAEKHPWTLPWWKTDGREFLCHGFYCGHPYSGHHRTNVVSASGMEGISQRTIDRMRRRSRNHCGIPSGFVRIER